MTGKGVLKWLVDNFPNKKAGLRPPFCLFPVK
jgi:hypothetical protein